MPGILTVSPISARLSRDTETFGTMDPYVSVTIGHQTLKTKTHHDGGKNPSWNGQSLPMKVGNEDVITFEIWDSDMMSKNDLIAAGSLALNMVCKPQQCSQEIQLYYKGKTAGTLYCNFYFQGDGGMNQGYQNQQGYPQGYPPQNQGYPPYNQGYPPQNQGYPPQNQGYPPQNYPPQNQGYPQQNQGYPPQNQGYPPYNQGYPPQNQGYPPQNQGYPPQHNQGYPPQYNQGYPQQGQNQNYGTPGPAYGHGYPQHGAGAGNWTGAGLHYSSFEPNLEQTFMMFDRDRSGNLSFDELYNALTEIFRRMNHPPPPYDIAYELMLDYDKSEDGKLSFKEFKRLVRDLCEYGSNKGY